MTEIVRQQHELPAEQVRGSILQLEREMKLHPGQIEIKTTHHFAPGVYAREIFIPKGTLLVGKIHRTEHINIVSIGDITVVSEAGLVRLKAPHTLISKPGTKRVGYAHEDTVWITIHPTDETDVEKIESILIAPSYDDLVDDRILDLIKGELQ